MTPDLESERVLLATLMLRPGDCWGAEVEPQHMASEQHGEILAAIRSLSADSQPCDPVSVADHFGKLKRPELGTLALQMASGAITTTQPKAYADRIRGAWRMRQARAIANTLREANNENAIDAAIERLLALNTVESQHEWTAKAAVQATFADLERRGSGDRRTQAVPSGLHDLDRLLGGFHRGDLTVVGARPSMGKTSLALGFARHAAKAGHPTGLISGEQPVEQVSSRLLSLASRVEATHFRSGLQQHEWSKVGDAMVGTAALPLWIFDRSSPSVAEVVRVTRRWTHLHHVEILFVDYLQRLEAEGERRFEAVGNAVKSLKNLARDLNVPVVVLAQVSRKVEDRKPPEPRMGDLSDSSEIEKEADQVLMLYRDEHYNADSSKKGIAKIIIEKNRHGPTGYIECAFHAPTMRFSDLAPEDPIWGDAA